MAAVDADDVTIVDTWFETVRGGPGEIMYRRISLDAGTNSGGGTTNLISATIMGMTTLYGCTNLVSDGDDKIFIAGINNAGTAVLVANNDDATAANHEAPADVAADVYTFTVWGRP